MPTLSEAFNAHPVRLHHHPDLLDFESFRELPDSHAWSEPDGHPSSGDDGDHESEPVPVVDLAAPDVLERMACACETWGVFQLTGHGVPARLFERLESESWRLFSLPAEQKLKALRSPDGIAGYGIARISSFFSKLMWSEGFTVVGSPVDHARKIWPNDYAQFCEVVEEYSREMKDLAGKLMGLMLASLGLTAEDLNWPGPAGEELRDASSALQLNSYPACPDPDRAMGLAAHTDSSLITILSQSSTSGLQVRRPGSDERDPTRWVTVPPMPGALVVNVGDLFQILSNGRYQSILHRAVVNRTRHRLSAAYSYGPPGHAEISPVGRLVGPGRAPSYRNVTWSEYLGIKAKHFDKALASIKV